MPNYLLGNFCAGGGRTSGVAGVGRNLGGGRDGMRKVFGHYYWL